MVAKARARRLIIEEPEATSAPIAPTATVDCPVKRLGERLAAVGAELARLDALSVGTKGSERNREAFNSLEDLQLHLEAQAEWLTPRSFEGVMLIAALMPHAADDAIEAAPEIGVRAGHYDRTFHRLNARLIEGLTVLSGRTLEDLGLGRYWRADLLSAGDRASPAVQV